jgi:Flp pilus assembly protein TadG
MTTPPTTPAPPSGSAPTPSGGLRRRWHRLAADPDRGAGGESLELVIVAVGVLMLIMFGIAAGRYSTGSNQVDQAAAAAARAGSLQADADTAHDAAVHQAQQTLTDAGVSCRGMTITVDTAAFTLPRGTPGTVRATVRCTVDWSDLDVPGLPGAVTLTSSATSPLDISGERRR